MSNSTDSNTLGIDFGTSNSAAGVLVNGKPYLIEIEPGHETLPTSVFFDFSSRRTLFGNAANEALIQGLDGRYMRSLKSVLGTSLMHEKRQMMDEKLSFVDIIARFLREVKTKAEAACHQTFDYAVSGRPVHFHSKDAAKDQQALADLKQCYHQAGFKGVRFLYEPEAAARANGALVDDSSIGLIVDIGGGTSDFSLFRSNGASGGIEIIASHGVRVGGTNFDKSISIDHVMPLFGRGSQIRREMGPGLLTAPNAIYHDLATWEKIPFTYTAQTRRDVDYLGRLAVEKPLFARLGNILQQELGHDVAFAVERGKIATNRADQETARIDLRVVERHLAADLTAAAMAGSLATHVQKIRECAVETLAMAGLSAGEVGRVIFVGGSSLMTVVEHAMRDVFPGAELQYTDAFTAVVDGLAIASGERVAA